MLAPKRFHAMKAAIKPPGDEPPPVWDVKRSADLLLFFMLMAAGIAYEIAIAQSFSSDGGMSSEIGSVLLGASMTPLLLSFWALAFGLGTKRSDDLRRVVATVFAYGLGVMLIAGPIDHAKEWGSKAFYMAMMFIINQLMLLEPDPEAATAKLMTKYKQALASAGTGMALSYFYNFVLPTAQSLEACVSAGTIAIQLEGAQRGQFTDAEFRPATAPRLNVICPKDLPPDDGDIKKQIRTLTTMEGGLKVGRLLPPKGAGGHRPMFLNFVEGRPGAAEEKPGMSAMLDIPTIISASYDRRAGVGKTLLDGAPSNKMEVAVAEADSGGPSCYSECQTLMDWAKLATAPCSALLSRWLGGGAKVTLDTASAGESAEEVGLTIAQEMTDFTNALYKLVDTHAVTRKHVTLWSVEPPPFVVGEIVEMCHAEEEDTVLDVRQMTRTLAGSDGAYTQLAA